MFEWGLESGKRDEMVRRADRDAERKRQRDNVTERKRRLNIPTRLLNPTPLTQTFQIGVAS